MKMAVYGFSAVVILLFWAFAYDAWKDFTCGAGFKGINTNWSLIAGCTVETKSGVWIPRNNYRSE